LISEAAGAERIMAEELKRPRWPESEPRTRLVRGEGGQGGTLAGGDEPDGGKDRGAPGDGDLRLSESPVVSPEEACRTVAIIKN